MYARRHQLFLEQIEMNKHTTSGDAGKNNINELPVNLTKRELQILKLICQELSNGEIAEMLFLSPRTVEGHRNKLLTKTGSKNTVGLVLFAVKYSLFSFPS